MGSEVEDSVRPGMHSREAASNLSGKRAEVVREEGALEEGSGILIDGGCTAVADFVEMDSELSGVERPPVAEILPWSDEGLPGLERHRFVSFRLRVDCLSQLN